MGPIGEGIVEIPISPKPKLLKARGETESVLSEQVKNNHVKPAGLKFFIVMEE